ncbi:Trypsin-like peptidase domain-containing protein [Singulisphaera sp. GP187]|nr:Trypsin-like peptidase domain-containing protein [Singulisphaera sp. GP187]
MKLALFIVLVATSALPPREGVAAQACTTSLFNENGGDSKSGRLTQRVGVAFKRVSPSIVSVEGHTKQTSRPWWRKTGVIVTADGLVLCVAGGTVDFIKVLLSDGREVSGRIVGWSGQWKLMLLRLDGDGPWPHAGLGDSPGVQPGQSVIALGFREYSGQPCQSPSLRLETVTKVDSSAWLGTTGGHASTGWTGEIVFNLAGDLVGLGDVSYPGQEDDRFFTDVGLIKSLWDNLRAGNDADRELLWTAAQREEAATPFEPSTPVTPFVRDRAASATVRMRAANMESEQPWSGVIVNRDGTIVTCQHHMKNPGDQLSIALWDGQTVAGKVLGVNPISDVGLAKITESGDWPHADMGDSRRLQPGTRCLVGGYPGELEPGGPPRGSAGVVVPPSHRLFVPGSYALHVKLELPVSGGMSGGGMFDPDGHVVAVVGASNRLDGDMLYRIEIIRAQWDHLLDAKFRVLDGDAAIESERAEVRRGVETMVRSVVTILDGDEPVALGTIVGPEGQIVTRGSGLTKTPSCRLADGRISPVEVVRLSRANDLALLKISANDLRAVPGWSAQELPSIGELVAIPTPGGACSIGSVSGSARPIPAAPNDEEFPHGGFPTAFEVGVGTGPLLTGGPVVDASGRMRGVAVSVASDGWLIVVPVSAAKDALHIRDNEGQ